MIATRVAARRFGLERVSGQCASNSGAHVAAKRSSSAQGLFHFMLAVELVIPLVGTAVGRSPVVDALGAKAFSSERPGLVTQLRLRARHGRLYCGNP